MLKIIIVVLLLCVIASLGSGLVFLFKDTDKPDSRRLWYALGVRVTFATLLVLTIAYGFYTGELRMGINAPWQAGTGTLLTWFGLAYSFSSTSYSTTALAV